MIFTFVFLRCGNRTVWLRCDCHGLFCLVGQKCPMIRRDLEGHPAWLAFLPAHTNYCTPSRNALRPALDQAGIQYETNGGRGFVLGVRLTALTAFAMFKSPSFSVFRSFHIALIWINPNEPIRWHICDEELEKRDELAKGR